jgi:hypothetical protein
VGGNTSEVTVVGLDLSTHTGYAVLSFQDGRVSSQNYGTFELPHPLKSYQEAPPWDFVAAVKDMATQAVDLVGQAAGLHSRLHIIIEEVNLGRDRLVQKYLSSLHFAVLVGLRALARPDELTTCIDSNGKSGWRTILGLKLSKEQAKANKMLRLAKKLGQPLELGLKKRLGVKGLTKQKHLAIEYVNTRPYGLVLQRDLIQKDNNEADAICLALARALQIGAMPATVEKS